MKQSAISALVSFDTVSQHEVLKIILEQTNDVMLLMDSAFCIVACSRKAVEMSASMIFKPVHIGENLFDLIYPERLMMLENVRKKVLALETVSYVYTSHESAEMFQLKYIPISNLSGDIEYVLMSGQNITREHVALKKIHASRELLQKAESIARIGSWEWHIATDKCIFSDEFYRLCGFEPGEIEPTRENGISLIHPLDRELALQTLENSYMTGDAYDIMLRITTKNIDQKFIRCQGIVTKNNEGKPEKFVGTFHDITAIKKLEDSVANTQHKYQFLVEQSTDMLLLVNDQREITFASPSVYQVIGYTPAEMLGKRLGDFAAEEDFPNLLENYKKIIATAGIPRTLEYRLRRKDGDYIWIEGTVNNLFNVENIESVVINQRDITHRKEAESILKSLNQHLSEQANNLKKSNADLERFAYIASHDLQQPLRMVQGFMELLQKKYAEQLDAKANEYIGLAVDGAHRMKILINALLEYSRHGNNNLKPESVDMNPKIKNIMHLFARNIEQSGAVIRASRLPIIYADKLLMGQLFQNIIGNALKYRSQEIPVIDVSSEENESHWIFSIADNGKGIRPEDRLRIFEVFQRLDSDNDSEGSGIGLSICKKIVEAHGGEIWVEENTGGGSRFRFTINKMAY